MTAIVSRRHVVSMLAATALAGCGGRGEFTATTPAQAAWLKRKVVYATNRAPTITGVARGNSLSYGLLEMATPNDRPPGQLDFTGPDAFTVASRSAVAPSGLAPALMSTVPRAGPGQNRLMLWVHGFNNTPAEAVQRQVQIAQDIGHNGAAVAFVWPSDGTTRGYIHDRDSAIHARDAHAELMLALSEVWDGEIVVIAHSLGAFLTLEAIGRLRLSGNGGRVMDGLVLVQPDVASDVFEAQIRDAQPLPNRAVLVVAQDDPVLRFSARLSQQPERVGASGDRARFEGLGITVLDLTNVTDARVPHLVAFSSPTVLNMLNRLVGAG